jgi:hypothetical protein
MLMSLAGLLWRHQHCRLPPAPPTAPCTAPSDLGGLPWGSYWESGGLFHGWLRPFTADVAACLGRLQSLVRWRNPWQCKQRRGNRQVATRCDRVSRKGS